MSGHGFDTDKSFKDIQIDRVCSNHHGGGGTRTKLPSYPYLCGREVDREPLVLPCWIRVVKISLNVRGERQINSHIQLYH